MILSRTQHETLRAIYMYPGSGIGELSELLGVGYHAARFRVRVLKEAGFVRMRKRLRRHPGQGLLEVVPAWPAVVEIEGRPCRLVVLDPPPDGVLGSGGEPSWPVDELVRWER